jgi:nucleoid-associated protein YgaU
MANFSEVSKMKIGSQSKKGGTVEDWLYVSVNPETYSRKFSTKEKSVNPQNVNGQKEYEKVVEFVETLSFELWLDSTGIIPHSNEVKDDIKWLEKNLTQYDTEIHSTRFLKIIWGNLYFECQLKNLDIQYLYFGQNGMPLRAKASVVFEKVTDSINTGRDRKSPDLTRLHTVQAGETLPLICFKVYKNAALYVKVAEANSLTHFTNIEPGQKIYLPPLVG